VSGICNPTVALPFCHLSIEALRPLPGDYPTELKTVGDHIRRRRLDLGLYQREVAKMFSVSKDTVHLWERHGNVPEIRLMVAIIGFLGYMPQAKPIGLPQQLHAYRMIRGLTQRQAAKEFGVDPSTWSAWENGLKQPGSRRTKSVLRLILQSLDSAKWYPA